MKRIVFLFLLISTQSFAQFRINYYYNPGLNELEVDLNYSKEDFTLGFRYNQEKNYFIRLEDNYIIYTYLQIPITNNLKFELSGGFGYVYDYEYSLIYNTPKFQFTFGRSLTDIIVFDIKHLIYYEKRKNRTRF